MSPEEQIRRTMGLYVRAHDTLDIDGMIALFVEDSVLANLVGEYRGLAAIRAFYTDWRAAWPPDRQGKLLCGNSIIAVHGDTAEALTDVVSFQMTGSEPWRINSLAHYADRFVHRAGRWRYAEKRALGLGSLPPGEAWAALVSTTGG